MTTGADGRFLFCGIPQDREIRLLAYLAYAGIGYAKIPPGGDDDFTARTLEEMAEMRTATMGTMTALLAGIAGVSLIVGGIGIMNIMLVSVTERTREIGIRKAIGATRRAILQQFLLESTVLAGLGGTIGVLVGLGIAFVGGLVLPRLVPDFPVPSVSPGSVVLALTVSLFIGLVAGGYPANRAARLRPIEALRYQ